MRPAEHRMINPVVDPVPRTNHRVVTTVLYDTMRPAEHRMINPVVDPVPRTNHRVITTVLYGRNVIVARLLSGYNRHLAAAWAVDD